MKAETANIIFNEIESNVQGNELLLKLQHEMFKAAADYANYRIHWYLADHDEQKEMNAARSRSHDAFIDTCNILSRNMESQGRDNLWRSKLGNNRKEIGDFACHVACIMGLSAA